MKTSTALSSVIIAIFAFVFCISAFTFWYISEYDVREETDAALLGAKRVIAAPLDPASTYEVLSALRHIKIATEPESTDAVAFLYDGKTLFVSGDAQSELEEIYISISVFFILFSLALCMTLWSVNRVVRAKETTIATIQQQLVSIQENERRKFAMELHDNVGQTISSIHVHAYMLQKQQLSADTTEQFASRITRMCEQLQLDIKQVISHLHPVMLSRLGFLTAIEQLCTLANENSQTRVTFVNEVTSWEDHESRDIQLFRICQEALQNALKHSGASLIKMHATDKGIAVTDDGCGFVVGGEKRGIGFNSMQERARIAQLALQIQSQPGQGVKIAITFS
jgi:signal transduction histidine kinase